MYEIIYSITLFRSKVNNKFIGKRHLKPSDDTNDKIHSNLVKLDKWSSTFTIIFSISKHVSS